MKYLMIAFLLLTTNAFADECGCTKDSNDPVCQAYFELKNEYDVRVICGAELGRKQEAHRQMQEWCQASLDDDGLAAVNCDN